MLPLCVIFLMGLVIQVNSNARFVCPRPASARSDISFYNQSMDYCGTDISRAFEQEHTQVSPGLFTLHFEETEIHSSSLFRVSLHDYDTKDFCVLLDHIPHSDNAVVTKSCASMGNDYPLGTCKESTYYINVNIPDITCDRCYLKLTHIILDSASDYSCNLNNLTCQGHVSCANIKIQPEVKDSEKNISSCVKYEENLAGDWPFRPLETYSVKLEVGTNVLIDPLLQYDPLHQTLEIYTPRHDFPSEIEEVQMVFNSTVVWSVNITEKHRQPITVFVRWTSLSSEDVRHLQEDELVLNIKCNKESFSGNVSFKYQNYTVGVYDKPLPAYFSSGGWLADSDNEDISVIMPIGPCVPVMRQFISYLHPGPVRMFIHGLLVATIQDDKAVITIALNGLSSNITSVTIKGSELLGAPDLQLPVSKLKDYMMQVSLDVASQTPYLDTVQFLKTVMVNTPNPAINLMGNFEEGINAVLREGREIRGIGAFQFTKGHWLKYEILVKTETEKLKRIELMGDDGIVYNLTDSIWHHTNSFCLVEGLIQALSSQLLLELWQGRLKLRAYTSTSILQGTLTVPGAIYCSGKSPQACFAVDLTFEGKQAAVTEGKVKPSGKAVFILDSTKVLQYSIEVNNVDQVENLNVNVKDGENFLFSIMLLPVLQKPQTYLAHSHLQTTTVLQQQLAAGELSLEIFLDLTKTDALRGTLPPIYDSRCTQPKTHIIGENRGYWSPEAGPFQTLYALLGDSLHFKYSGNVTLFSVDSKEELHLCNLTNATQVGPEVVNGTVVTFTKKLDAVGNLYFVSLAHCDSKPPLTLVVTVTDPAYHLDANSSVDSCGTLVFAGWHRDQLEAYQGPNPLSPTVSGIVLGSLIAVAFITWQRRLQEKSAIAIPGSRFQRF